jgi:hypothetical protein
LNLRNGYARGGVRRGGVRWKAVRMQWVEALGYIAAFLMVGAHAVGTMIPLRAIGIGANCFFILYGLVGGVYPLLALHAILLPLNAARLYQMLQLVRNVKAAAQGDLNTEWLKPFMRTRATRPDEVIFRKGDLSSAMYYTVTGLPPGRDRRGGPAHPKHVEHNAERDVAMNEGATCASQIRNCPAAIIPSKAC